MQHRDRFLLLFLLSLALALSGSEARPQDEKGEAKDPYAERFEQLDRDHDGYIVLTEWPLDAASFQKVDGNSDGRLSRNELLSPNSQGIDPVAEEFRALDANRDGCISWDEWQRGHSVPVQRDRPEAAPGPSTVRPEPGRPEAPDRQNVWRSDATLQDQRRFRDLDRNRDNRLSPVEWTGSRASFDRLDRNRDGALSPNEWQ